MLISSFLKSLSLYLIICFFSVSLVYATDLNYISPDKVTGAVTIDSKEAKALFDEGVFFIDVRKDSDYEAGRIPGAVQIEFDDKNPDKTKFTDESLKEHDINFESEIVLYCNGIHCARSSMAAEMAIKWGYKKVYYYRLGFPDWKSNNFPFE